METGIPKSYRVAIWRPRECAGLTPQTLRWWPLVPASHATNVVARKIRPAFSHFTKEFREIYKPTSTCYLDMVVGIFRKATAKLIRQGGDRKSTRLNSSHGYISYAVFCLKKN